MLIRILRRRHPRIAVDVVAHSMGCLGGPAGAGLPHGRGASARGLPRAEQPALQPRGEPRGRPALRGTEPDEPGPDRDPEADRGGLPRGPGPDARVGPGGRPGVESGPGLGALGRRGTSWIAIRGGPSPTRTGTTGAGSTSTSRPTTGPWPWSTPGGSAGRGFRTSSRPSGWRIQGMEPRSPGRPGRICSRTWRGTASGSGCSCGRSARGSPTWWVARATG